MSTLRQGLSRLAQENPELRKHLVPLLRREAALAKGEVYPKVRVAVRQGTITVWTTTVVAWGNQPSATTRLIQDSAKLVQDGVKALSRQGGIIGELTLGSLFANPTKQPGMLYFTYNLYVRGGSFTPEQEVAIRQAIADARLQVATFEGQG